MVAIICTLFEGNYHYGVAALINSLHKQGFRGNIYAGYRGALPSWANKAELNNFLNWPAATTLNATDDLQIHFLPLTTDYHLTNYKPDFMLRLWREVDNTADELFYFDPDIVLKCKWNFFSEWIQFGVALVHEVISNDMPVSHPVRRKWEDVIRKSGKKSNKSITSYINGGFCGISRKNINFIETWRDIMHIGYEYYNLSPKQWIHDFDRSYEFYMQDQDGLNMTAMCCDCNISEIGPEAMDFIHGGNVMSHSTGLGKPWNKSFLINFLKGIPPAIQDKQYWQNVNLVIKTYNPLYVKWINTQLSLASFLARFYSRK